MGAAIVLDKSFLVGASATQIGKLCEEAKVLMCEPLFFELIMGDPAEAARCFRKFPSGLNPVELIHNLGELMRFEISHHIAADVLPHRLAERWEFNRRLATGELTPTPEQKGAMAEWERYVAEAASGLRERILAGPETIPTLPAVRGKLYDFTIDGARSEVAQDSESVRRFYDAVRPPHFPPAQLLNPKWALFRWTQVQLSYVLEYLGRYGPRKIECNEVALRHDVLDAQYVVMGLLSGALASRDKRMIKLFKMLGPGSRAIE